MNKRNCDFLIAGGGIVGLSIANQLIEKQISKKIVVLDKENELGRHSSGRNSGVLHAGIYYEPDSLKSKVCVSGAKKLKEWINNRNIEINHCGKLIIPQKEELDSQLDNLYERASRNGALVNFVGAKEIEKLAPHANITSGRGLWSPNTSVVNPLKVIARLQKELEEKGVEIITSAKNWEVDSNFSQIKINNNLKINFGFFINTAGLHADKVAQKFNIASEYRIIPFKGIYWRLRNNCPFNIKCNLYPVPDLNMPFLGVHFTPDCLNESVSIGPTAIPALGRENYSMFEKIEIKNSISNFSFLSQQYFMNKNGFRKYVHEQALQGFPLIFLNSAQELIPKLKYFHIEPCKKVGLRAQLFNLKTKTMEKDFLCLRGERSIHIINTISPAFTASFALADLIIEKYLLPQINK